MLQKRIFVEMECYWIRRGKRGTLCLLSWVQATTYCNLRQRESYFWVLYFENSVLGGIDSYSWAMVEVEYERNKITAVPCTLGLLVVEEDVLGHLAEIYTVVREKCVYKIRSKRMNVSIRKQ